MRLLQISFFLLIFSLSLRGFAQTSEAEQELSAKITRGIELGVHTGPFLSSGVAGVREILPFFGVRFGIPYRKMQVEATVLSGRAEGTEYHQGDLGVRIDLDLDFINYFVLFGGDFHYWKREPSEFRQFEYRNGLGWHTGFGFFYPISPDLSFRTDFKINFGPGVSMFVGFGFVVHFGTSSEGTEQQTAFLKPLNSFR